MTFWCGSGSWSADPYLWLMDPDPASKKIIFYTIFSSYYFLKVHLHHFSKIKSQKESQNSRNQGFSCYFCMMIEGSGSGSIPLTSGSGSGRPKNMWIRWIRIRWIRIRNTGTYNNQTYLLAFKRKKISGGRRIHVTSCSMFVSTAERWIKGIACQSMSQ